MYCFQFLLFNMDDYFLQNLSVFPKTKQKKVQEVPINEIDYWKNRIYYDFVGKIGTKL